MTDFNFRFYGELNDHLPASRRQREFRIKLIGDFTLQEILELFNIPCYTVALILADGHPVDLTYKPRVNQRISLFPEFHSIDISPMNRYPQENQSLPC